MKNQNNSPLNSFSKERIHTIRGCLFQGFSFQELIDCDYTQAEIEFAIKLNNAYFKRKNRQVVVSDG